MVQVLKGCLAMRGHNPWYKYPNDGGVPLGGRIYQEAYTNDWWSYQQDTRTRKVSIYQFRAPGEWFAEAYAAYYEPSANKGDFLARVDATTKAWFDANVDPDGGTKTSGPSGVPSQNDQRSQNGQPGAGDTVEQAIKKHVAKQMSVPAGEVEVTILADADVPGLAVFSMYIAPPQKGRPGRHIYDVAAGSTVETDRAAAQKMVLDAWSYGPERAVTIRKEEHWD